MFENWFPRDMTTLRKLLWFRTAWEKSVKPPTPSDPLSTFVGSIVRFLAKRAKPIVKLEANFTPIQSGTGDPSPENIRPISGHTGCEVVRTGKNLLAKPFAFRPVPSQFSDCFFIKAGTYTFSFDSIGTATSWRFGISMFDKDGNELSANKYIPHSNTAWVASVKMWYWAVDVSVKTITLTFAEDCYTRIWFGSGNTSSDMVATGAQLELGSTASDYEPFSGTTVSISFGQTVYGCQLTVFEDGSGQAVAETGNIVYDGSIDETWGNDTASNYGFYVRIPTMKSGSIMDGKASWLLTYTGSGSQTGKPQVRFGSGNDYIYCRQITNNIPGVTDLATWKTFLSENNLQVTYPLAEPITIPLTAYQINTLVGTNTIWVNDATGDITVQAYGTAIT